MKSERALSLRELNPCEFTLSSLKEFKLVRVYPYAAQDPHRFSVSGRLRHPWYPWHR